MYSDRTDRVPLGRFTVPDGGDPSQEGNLGALALPMVVAAARGPLPTSRGGGRDPPPGRSPKPEVTR